MSPIVAEDKKQDTHLWEELLLYRLRHLTNLVARGGANSPLAVLVLLFVAMPSLKRMRGKKSSGLFYCPLGSWSVP
jgi:hypothetical protein